MCLNKHVFSYFIVNIHAETLIGKADGYFIGDTKSTLSKTLSSVLELREKLIDPYFSEL
jgi:hypothetical protein